MGHEEAVVLLGPVRAARRAGLADEIEPLRTSGSVGKHPFDSAPDELCPAGAKAAGQGAEAAILGLGDVELQPTHSRNVLDVSVVCQGGQIRRHPMPLAPSPRA